MRCVEGRLAVTASPVDRPMLDRALDGSLAGAGILDIDLQLRVSSDV
jgi:hypothetical protein